MAVKKKLIIIAGPTAVGKTDFSIQLAKAIHGEIISADSSQVYRGFDIASAKIKPHEMAGIPHHLIDILNPDEDYSVYDFQQQAITVMNESIYPAGHIPIIAGGTGFYIQSVLYDIAFEERNPLGDYGQWLVGLAAQHETSKLHDLLKEVDPESAKIIHENNTRRVISALTFYHDTGIPLSRHNKEQRMRESAYNFAYFVLTMDRNKLYERINRRVDLMMEEGALAEVERLRAKGVTRDMPAMKGIGYRELYEYLEGQYSLETAVEQIKQNTRHFAKRQLTWFRREKEVTWLDKDRYSSEEELLLDALNILKSKDII